MRAIPALRFSGNRKPPLSPPTLTPQTLLTSIPTTNPTPSVAEWLTCWTQAQKGQGSNRSRDAVG